MSPVEIQIPPRPEYVGVVRLAVASLARHHGIHEERVDDLKIAISEACTRAVVADAASPITVSWATGERRVVVEVSGLPPAPAEDPSAVDSQGLDTRHTMSEALLGSLVDSYETEAGPSGSLVRLSLNV